jgi:hypothetical protein
MDGGLAVEWDQPIPIFELRQFTAEFFDWHYRFFAGKFVHTLAFPLLVRKLLAHGTEGTDGSNIIGDITLHKDNELRVQFLPPRLCRMTWTKMSITPTSRRRIIPSFLTRKRHIWNGSRSRL